MYWCKTGSSDITISPEHSDYMWVTADEALRMIEKPSMQNDIRSFIKEKYLESKI